MIRKKEVRLFIELIKYCIVSYKRKLKDTNSIFNGAIRKHLFRNKIDSGYIVEYSDKIVLCFKGTRGIRAWAENVDTFPYMKKKRHDGFYEGWERFRTEIFEFISKGKTYKKMYITGHSRGGAIAPNAAYEIAKRFKMSITLACFAPPNFCLEEFKNDFYDLENIEAYRVINGADPIEKVPFQVMGFTHVGERFHIGRGSNIFRRLGNNIQSKLLGIRCIDHAPRLYLKSLKKELRRADK